MCSSCGAAELYTTYSYHSAGSRHKGTGRLTGEAFSGARGSGSYATNYDTRREATNTSLTIGGATNPVSATYNDAGQVLAHVYLTGETVTMGYSAQGWLGSLACT